MGINRGTAVDFYDPGTPINIDLSFADTEAASFLARLPYADKRYVVHTTAIDVAGDKKRGKSWFDAGRITPLSRLAMKPINLSIDVTRVCIFVVPYSREDNGGNEERQRNCARFLK